LGGGVEHERVDLVLDGRLVAGGRAAALRLRLVPLRAELGRRLGEAERVGRRALLRTLRGALELRGALAPGGLDLRRRTLASGVGRQDGAGGRSAVLVEAVVHDGVLLVLD